MAVLSLIYKNSDDELEASNKIFYNILNSEIIKLRRMDILNRHFPKVIRDSLEQNPQLFKNKQVLPTAVIGFVDIVSSCAISNNVPLYIEWELKERFMEAATKRAMETEMVVLTYAGDAFLFLANFRPDSLWYYNLIIFYENLVKDYDLICKDLNLDLENITSGIKFGITQGPVVLGFLGKSQAYFTVIGPDVNLAARLSSQAKPNQIVVSSRIWHSMKPLLVGWDHEFNEYSDLKGFDCVIPTVHLFPKQLRMSKTDFVCAICESTMSLIKTEEGTLDFRCVNGHSTPKMATKIKMLKSS
jgi:class 3 adenylate cyclase